MTTLFLWSVKIIRQYKLNIDFRDLQTRYNYNTFYRKICINKIVSHCISNNYVKSMSSQTSGYGKLACAYS